MLSLRLNCGRDVCLFGFEYNRTYVGPVEGRANGKTNASIIADLTQPTG
jgi:hypothetical protein